MNLNETVSCVNSSVSGCVYPYEWAQPNYYYYPVSPVIDYDLLAQKIVDKLQGKEKRTVEDLRKDLNRLLDELKGK